tara:strand:- start:1092 stop:1364 length:273 start_codon:yes stop_codon:yes gene_type:complete
MRDKIIEQVINKIKSRSDVGFKKYKVTLHQDQQPLDVWLTHIQEELMDAVNYIEKAKAVLQDEIEEVMIKRSEQFNDNISNIDITDEEIL